MFSALILTSRIERLEATVRRQQVMITELCARLGIESSTIDPARTLDATEIDLIGQGKKIAAMKHHRQRTGSSLVEARDVIERSQAHGSAADGA